MTRRVVGIVAALSVVTSLAALSSAASSRDIGRLEAELATRVHRAVRKDFACVFAPPRAGRPAREVRVFVISRMAAKRAARIVSGLHARRVAAVRVVPRRFSAATASRIRRQALRTLPNSDRPHILVDWEPDGDFHRRCNRVEITLYPAQAVSAAGKQWATDIEQRYGRDRVRLIFAAPGDSAPGSAPPPPRP